MQTVELNNNTHMPTFGLGTWKSKPGEVHQAVQHAVRAGYRHIDCAWIYGNEAEVGHALQELFLEGVVTRDQLWITSKLWNDRHAPQEVPQGLRETLQNLQLTYLDLYLIHWPVALRKDAPRPLRAEDMIDLDQMPIAATWRAMEQLAQEGLCRTIGVSNFSVPKLQALCNEARITPAVNQVELHPYLQQNELHAFCQRQNIHLTAYAPLGSRDRIEALKTEDEPVLLDDNVIATIAQKHGATSAQILIAWALCRNTSVIPKSVNPERIQQNLAATHFVLDAEDQRRMATLDRHRRYVDGTFWALEGGPYTLANLWDE